MITLATLPESSLQEIFTQARDHLLKQNCKSNWKGISKDLTCKYRGVNGTMCAIGCFIHDDEYKYEMDALGGINTSFGGLVNEGLFPKISEDRQLLLQSLQYLHDNHEPHEWAEKLLEIAIKLDLEWV